MCNDRRWPVVVVSYLFQLCRADSGEVVVIGSSFLHPLLPCAVVSFSECAEYHRVAAARYFEIIVMAREDKSAYQRAYIAKRRKAGLCMTCGKPRGANGTKYRCRLCADGMAARERGRVKSPVGVSENLKRDIMSTFAPVRD